jgi:hypothetical protein
LSKAGVFGAGSARWDRLRSFASPINEVLPETSVLL